MPPEFDYATLRCEVVDDHVLVVAFNRPDAANALNTEMGREVADLFMRLILDPGALRSVVLTGTGDKVFCAGGDLKQRNGMDDAAWRRQHAIFEQAFHALMDCPIPIIAAVNGAAFGGGCEFALACDFIYASRAARFAQTETQLGIIPGGGGTQTLARAVGPRRAKELIFSATVFTAEEAYAWGMVNHLSEPGALILEVLAVARRIAAAAPLAVRQAKRAIVFGTETDLKTGLAFEIEAYHRTVTSRDRHEGVAAFNEKRVPDFKGE